MADVMILTTPSCTNCAAVERMLDKMGVKYEVIDITRNPEMLQKYPILAAPGVVINGKLEFVGVPREKELTEKLKNA
ncbi:MAG: thioredoxin family protein [Candidatus Methanoperedens sp.]